VTKQHNFYFARRALSILRPAAGSSLRKRPPPSVEAYLRTHFPTVVNYPLLIFLFAHFLRSDGLWTDIRAPKLIHVLSPPSYNLCGFYFPLPFPWLFFLPRHAILPCSIPVCAFLPSVERSRFPLTQREDQGSHSVTKIPLLSLLRMSPCPPLF